MAPGATRRDCRVVATVGRRVANVQSGGASYWRRWPKERTWATRAASRFRVTTMEKTKIASIKEMISRRNGATIAELTRRTGWKPHSVRAAISSLRKDGIDIRLEPLESRGMVYHLA